jgi:hypothetical protein
MNRSLVVPWLVEIGLISYRAATNAKVSEHPRPIPGLPLPGEIAGAMVVFGALSIIPGNGQRVATAAGWGLVVATLLNLWNPGGTSVKLSTKQSTKKMPAATAGREAGKKMARFASIASLVVIGVIIADILTHPQGVKAASSGITGVVRPSLNALLGQPS